MNYSAVNIYTNLYVTANSTLTVMMYWEEVLRVTVRSYANRLGLMWPRCVGRSG